MKVCLFVRAGSMPYVRRLIASFHATLRDFFGSETPLILGDELDTADIGDAELVFVVGEALAPFTRLPGRRYVYLNFSVVAFLGNPFNTGLDGLRLIRRKRRLLAAKLELVDAVLDYYPAQTRHLQATFPVPVFGFLPTIAPPVEPPTDLALRPYDICFVGSGSARRDRIAAGLKAMGLTLSPSSGADLEVLAARSRCTLNVHLQRSNHLELPRILGAISASSPVVSELSHAMHDVVPRDLLAGVGPYRSLAAITQSLLADVPGLQRRADAADQWYRKTYLPRAEDHLRDTLAKVAALPPAR